ncbi:MAG: sialidase family protein [Thermoplasmatota archaeon]
MPPLRTRRAFVLSVAALLVAGGLYYVLSRPPAPSPPSGEEGGAPLPPGIVWEPIYVFNEQGYEPGIAMDSKGYMYYTAHKNLDDKSSWDYLASWFFVGTPDGKSWRSPSEPFPRGNMWKTYLGDEGDIAVDAQDNVYFVDTYLIDNHIHVWSDQGQYQYSVRVQKTTGLDDRPWISAQGDQIVHYLGNNAVEVRGGRYWYYRSTNGARTFTAGQPVPGNGWGLIDAERYGSHVYIISETEVDAEADIAVYVSDDMGATWDFGSPITIAHRDGPGREYPVISAGSNGTVWALWNDASNGVENGTRIFAAWSYDYGRSWNYSDITPFKAFIDYPTINVGPDGSVGVAFYATRTLPVSDQSEWHIYGGMLRPGPDGRINVLANASWRDELPSPYGHPRTLRFNFTKGEEGPCYVGSDLHALHDFFEIVVGYDGYLNVAYQHYIGPENGHSELFFVRGTLPAREGAST